ncbi:HNH endonuclease [Euzebyella saccharophila]|uniref:HNH endonuclease n=1 Tax=Euzebyella saccharophila TaxID=679664 RepID=A0ABV8JSY3_9FLAO|nr:HNH endonuclease [Euzebyella saccharophila]
MGFPPKIKVQALVASARHCCACHKAARRKIEVHHIVPYAISKDNSFENAIPLCYDCHDQASHYNNNEPKGNKYSPQELRKHRDNWYKIVSAGKVKYFDVEEYNKRHLPVFQEMNKVVERGYSYLLSNDLISFNQSEEKEIDRVFNNLILNRFSLIKGNPAIGKTVFAIKIAERFRDVNYTVLYHSFKYHRFSSNDIINSLNNMRDENILFIIDDSHLDLETASKIKYYFVDNYSPCSFLFLSRNISDHLDFTSMFNNSFFDEFEENNANLEVIKFSKKIENIIKKYQRYYSKKYSRPFYVGSNAKIVRHVGDNLIALKAYLDLWEYEETLSKIGKEKMLREFYKKQYHKLDDATIKCLNIYLSLYSHEIPFEVIPEYEKETLVLERNGIIFRYNHTLYFEHSKTTNLYLESYYKFSVKRVDKEFDTLPSFIDSNLKEYLKLFEDNQYPDNTHHIITYFLSRGKAHKDLLSNKGIENIILKYYSRCTVSETLVFLNRISIYAPKLFTQYFNELILSSGVSKKYLSNDMFAFFYASFRRNLKPSGNDSYIINLFNYEEIRDFFKNANLTGFKQGVAFLYNIGEKSLALNLLRDCDDSLILGKIYNSNISEISHFFNYIHKKNELRGLNLLKTLINSSEFYLKLNEMIISSVNLSELLEAIDRFKNDLLWVFSKKYHLDSFKMAEGINERNIKFFLNSFHLYYKLYPISSFKILMQIRPEVYISWSKKIIKFSNKSYKHIVVLLIGAHYKQIEEATSVLVHDMIENMTRVRSCLDFNQYSRVLFIMSNYFDMRGFVNELDKQNQSVLKQKIGNLKEFSGVQESILLLDKILPGQKQIFNDWLKQNRASYVELE